MKKDKIKKRWVKTSVMEKIAFMSDRADLKKIYSKINDMELNYTQRQYEEAFPIILKEFVDLL